MLVSHICHAHQSVSCVYVAIDILIFHILPRPLEDVDSSPPCMADIFRCMGRAARAALCAMSRHLRLRSE